MANFTWKDSYSVGVAEFDEQHKTIISLINEIYGAMSSGTGRLIVNDTLEKLFDYAENHFSTEEVILIKTGYPAFSEHKEAHQQFISKISKLKDDASKGDLLTLMKIADFLKDWTIDHILGVDKEYSAFLNSKGIN